MSTMPQSPTSQVTYTDLLIRRMRLTDIPEVMAIEAVSFGRHHWSPDSFRSEIKNQVGRYYSLVYRPQNCVIGYCGYWLILDEAHITTIATDPAFRGQGLGELLLIKMVDRMATQSVKWVTLEVRVSNFSAQQLYYKYLFRSMGQRPHYYQDTREDALIMTTENINAPEFRKVLRDNKQKLTGRLGGRLPEGGD